MTLSSGTRLGPYEILAAIGAGGMGEVYKARDTRLDRSVAVKVLPPQFSADPERRARFEREAKTIAGLTHPHICTLYDVGEREGSTFLVMEHLTGETLAQRLEKAPLPLEQALTVATDIADALSAAHRQGVIHRDLKPGNVMLTKAGAKLLDFGLAKLKGHGERPAAAHLESAPTQATPLTGEGMIVGTLQYMAPEQVEGKPADARTDLWALGAILYEMLTGKRAFEGTSAASLIGAILEREPAPLATLQPLTPLGVDRLVRQCLAKAQDDRPDTAHDLANELRLMRETSGVAVAAGTARRPGRLPRTGVFVGGLVVGAVLAGAGVWWWLRPAEGRVGSPVARVSLDVRPAESLDAEDGRPGGYRTALAWTPDGEALVFVGRRAGMRQLFVRRLDAVEARALAGTEGAVGPAVSADGQWVAFFADGVVKKVPLRGGPVDQILPLAAPPAGFVWDDRGRLFGGGGGYGIGIVPAEGNPEWVTKVGDGELGHILPWPLPGGQGLVYTVRKRMWSWGDEEVVAQALDTSKRTPLLTNAQDARYLPTGHLVFLRQGKLFAVPFDAAQLRIGGKEVLLLDDVAQVLTMAPGGISSDVSGAGQFAVAPTGTLAWVPSPVVPYADAALVSVDRTGRVTPLPAPPRSYAPRVRLSPDGRRLAVTVRTLTEVGLYLLDLERGTLSALNRDGESYWHAWSRDAQRLAFSWLSGGRRFLAAQAADGTGTATGLAKGAFYPSSFTPDGQQIVAVRVGAAGSYDIVAVKVGREPATVQPLMETGYQEQWPDLSPDGHWLAYGSDKSGRNEVYVRSYPALGPEQPVSVEGGQSPAWNPNGRELFFVSPTDATGRQWMMAADFTSGPPPRIGRPRRLYSFDAIELDFHCYPLRCYDVAPDGQRFFGVRHPLRQPLPAVTHINIIFNWLEELNAKVPVR